MYRFEYRKYFINTSYQNQFVFYLCNTRNNVGNTTKAISTQR